MTEKQKAILGILKVLKIFLAMFFVIGLIMNYDGYEILRNQKNYKPGLLKFDSLYHSSDDQYGNSSPAFWGHVDSIATGITFDQEDSPEMKVFFENISLGKEASIPVWFRADGKLTLHRYPLEVTFPKKRIWEKVIMFILFLNVPLIAVWIIDLRLKRKYQKTEKYN